MHMSAGVVGGNPALRSSLEGKLSRVRDKERLRSERRVELERRRERKQQLKDMRRWDDERMPGNLRRRTQMCTCLWHTQV